jgi:hypothetical protein
VEKGTKKGAAVGIEPATSQDGTKEPGQCAETSFLKKHNLLTK